MPYKYMPTLFSVTPFLNLHLCQHIDIPILFQNILEDALALLQKEELSLPLFFSFLIIFFLTPLIIHGGF